MLLVALFGCAPPNEAPTDLDALLHWFFLNRETATEDELRDAATNLRPLIEQASRGTVTPLTPDEQGAVEMAVDADPADASGIFVAGPVDCTIDAMERVHYALDQEGLYEAASGEEKYIAYDRVYTTSLEDYEAGATPTLGWETTYTVNPVFTEYTAVIHGGMRFVPEADGVGPVIIERAHLPSPAVMAEEGGDFFDQDYQIDVMLPDGATSIHAYAVWRDLQSATLPDENEGVQNLMLDGFEEFDRDTELVCAAGGF